MNLSYWERSVWFNDIDFAIIGSGIVGLNCALTLREKHPKAKIAVFERGMLPSGASTKNAGFACFGSVSELLDDLKTHSEKEVLQLIEARVSGLALLRKTIGDHNLNFKMEGGYELFSSEDIALYENCMESVPGINLMLKEVFPDKKDVFSIKKDPFQFKNVQKHLIFNNFEGQLNTGLMMKSLLRLAGEQNILVLNNAKIESFSSKNGLILLEMNDFEPISTKKLFIATNGFAKQFINEDLNPARAQVVITKPIKDLHLKGSFHLDKGFYYFRNIDRRVLLGGGRNLDFKTEETTEEGLTDLVQNRMFELLRTTILPGRPFEIESRWSGVMGVGGQKKPIIKKVQENVYCGVRLGGMGVAIGSTVGKQLADLENT